MEKKAEEIANIIAMSIRPFMCPGVKTQSDADEVVKDVSKAIKNQLERYAAQRVEEELTKVIKAWEKLPEGNHSPIVIQDWLVNDMSKAINNSRNLIK